MERYTRKDAFAQFNRLIERGLGARIATSHNDVGAYQLDWNPTYGGGVIERITNAGGGVCQPFGSRRHNAKDFCAMVHFTMRVLEQFSTLGKAA